MPRTITQFTASGSGAPREKWRRLVVAGIAIMAAIIILTAAGVLPRGATDREHSSSSREMKFAAIAPGTDASVDGVTVAHGQAFAPVDAPHFSTQPATGVFADGGGGYTSAQCAATVDAGASSDMYNGQPLNEETVPQNQQEHSPGSPPDGITSPVNQTKPNAAQLAYYASDGYSSSQMDPPFTWMKMVDGQYSGTTEMIIRWAACKWGMDEDMIRAQATIEHDTWVQWNAGGDARQSINQCQAGNDPGHQSTNLWAYLVSNACYQSWSNWQIKVVYSIPNIGAWTTWPAINESTAFAVDYRYGFQRSCMNGNQSGYFSDKGIGGVYLADVANAKNNPQSESPHQFWNPVTGANATNLEYVEFACLSSHYSGGWMDPQAQSYLNKLLAHWKDRDWLPK